mmetsp:Transcript_3614/g.8001  ORF Transcript_3614/g.8001 Transcript_3614/m.8001 type:complete len:101 (+) Transcript_3614:56-358(+)
MSFALQILFLHNNSLDSTKLRKSRAKETGRLVPRETLEMSLKQVPISVNILAPMADFFCELDNSPTSGDVTMTTESITWDSFRDNWAQTCPWVPGQRGKM